jgi:hypothetical protein
MHPATLNADQAQIIYTFIALNYFMGNTGKYPLNVLLIQQFLYHADKKKPSPFDKGRPLV